MHEFKHPKYYTELRKRNKALRSCDAYSKENSNYTERQQSDQVISRGDSTEAGRRAPDQGQSSKPQATSSKPQASSTKSIKPQATSFKPQA